MLTSFHGCVDDWMYASSHSMSKSMSSHSWLILKVDKSEDLDKETQVSEIPFLCAFQFFKSHKVELELPYVNPTLPGVDRELIGGIMHLICPGSVSGCPRRNWKICQEYPAQPATISAQQAEENGWMTDRNQELAKYGEVKVNAESTNLPDRTCHCSHFLLLFGVVLKSWRKRVFFLVLTK